MKCGAALQGGALAIRKELRSCIKTRGKKCRTLIPSEVIRDALRDKQNRLAEIEYIREKLIKAEQSGFVDETPEQLLAGYKERAKIDGKL